MKATTSFAATVCWPLIVCVASVGMLGVYNLHSATAAHAMHLYTQQAAWLGIGLVLMLLMMHYVDYRLTATLAYPFYGGICLLLALVMVLGRSVMGAKRWLVLGGMQFQPSEFSKLALIFCLSRYFSIHAPAEGYSLRTLLRPMNVSRPCVLLLLTLKAWNKPYLLDPIGELARLVHSRMSQTAPLPIENLLWFRTLLLLLLLGSGGLALHAIYRKVRDPNLLSAWSKGFAQRMALLIVCLEMALLGLLFAAWYQPFLADPVGIILTSLNNATQYQGMYSQLTPRWWPKIVLLISLVVYLLATLLLGSGRKRSSLSKFLLAPIDLLILPVILVLIEPDLGTAIVLMLIGISIVLMVGLQLRSMILLLGMGLLMSVLAWFAVLKDYQKRRILTFIDPEQDIRGAGWNAVQSLIAVGSGRWFGKGHLNGSQTQLSFLPEQHTDFAFSVWAEEQGFIGSSLLLVLYFSLFFYTLQIASQAKDSFGALLAVGVTAMVAWQVVINIGMVSGALPVVGITLPLFSYGGSSMLTVLVGMGLLLNMHRQRRLF